MRVHACVWVCMRVYACVRVYAMCMRVAKQGYVYACACVCVVVAHEAVEQRQVGVRDLGNGRLGQRVPAEGYDEG